jgi:hypothetical protein
MTLVQLLPAQRLGDTWYDTKYLSGGKMKGLILIAGLLISGAAYAQMDQPIDSDFSAGDAASLFVNDSMTRAVQILAQKSAGARLSGICSLVKSRVSYTGIGATWLGQYRNLAREKNAVQQFYRLVPSILVSKVFQGMGNGGTGSVSVDPNSTARGGGVYEVGMTITTGGGSSYHGKAVVAKTGGSFKVVDALYAGFSAVNYLGRDYQNSLNDEYNKDPNRSMPVTALIRAVMSEDGFTRCP